MDKYEKILAVLFLLSLPLINPWVRGDGVGYYAFARAILMEHRLDFEPDWQNANASFRLGRIDPNGHIRPTEYTSTGHLDNHFSIGPAILWSPFLLAAEAVVQSLQLPAAGHQYANRTPQPGHPSRMSYKLRQRRLG